MANGTSKNLSLGKFRPDLEISKAFLKGLEVSFSRVFLRLGVSDFFSFFVFVWFSEVEFFRVQV